MKWNGLLPARPVNDYGVLRIVFERLKGLSFGLDPLLFLCGLVLPDIYLVQGKSHVESF